nr:uncharacterized protein LOC115264976 [Aedes albopictus]
MANGSCPSNRTENRNSIRRIQMKGSSIMMDTRSVFNCNNNTASNLTLQDMSILPSQFNGGISSFDTNTVSKSFDSANSQEYFVDEVQPLQRCFNRSIRTKREATVLTTSPATSTKRILQGLDTPTQRDRNVLP